MTRRALPIHRSPRRVAVGFTLAELLASIAVILIIAGITAVSVRNIARDARLSSGVNTVTAALDTARGLAIRDNKITAVVFQPRLEGTSRQYVEVVTVQWTGEIYFESGSTFPIVDRFAPVSGLSPRRLPRGIKIASPRYGENFDDQWVTLTHLPAINPETGQGEWPGQLIAVMYSPQGTVITRNSFADTHRSWFDVNNDRRLQYNGVEYTMISDDFPSDENIFEHYREVDEPYVNFAPFISVYDDDAAREEGNPASWTDEAAYQSDLTGPDGFITRNADRLHFNRYTGVILK